ncbi:MAG TPA: methenyltetrahydromethanopterin cyclohydrolase [Anaerolineaceae bacterium]|nr:methenyltetrahydromethanopterin cyclohydrolase [Anaerolineaceae bacterium]
MISINGLSAAIVQTMISRADALGCQVFKLANGATVIDAGVQVPGSLEAGRLFSEACLGGLGQVSFTRLTYMDNQGEFWLPAVSVSVSFPPIACMASQYAGWAIQHDKFFAMGSGPARALYAREEIFSKLNYQDKADTAVLLLEGHNLPSAEVAEYVAGKCGLGPDCLTLIIAPTASLAGTVQISARVVETGLHKMLELGYDMNQVVSGFGVCPLASIASDDLHAIGRTNDAVLYGGQVVYSVRGNDEELANLVEKVPSSASPDYGVLFYNLFQRYEGDFYKIDPLLFSPAQISFNNLISGHNFHSGRINPSLLRLSLLEG